MSINIIVLGAGFGGLEASTGLKRELGKDVSVTLVDKKDYFMTGFNKYDILFGREADIRKGYYRDLVGQGVDFLQEEVVSLELEEKRVVTDKRALSYDYLIVALGADLHPEAIPRFVSGGYEFYSPEGARRLRPVIEAFQGGTILISIFDKVYKCPPAPYELAFLLDDYFRAKGMRERVNLKVLTPVPRPLPVSPTASDEIERLLAECNIELLTQRRVIELDSEHQCAIVEGHSPLAYDLFIGIPIHKPPKVILDSPLGAAGWVAVDRENLHTSIDNVYAVGDVTSIPVGGFAVPKAGVFAENAARVVVQDLVSRIRNRPAASRYEARGACFVEFGRGRIAMLDADFLSQAQPQVVLKDIPGEVAPKKTFVAERLRRWFGYG